MVQMFRKKLDKKGFTLAELLIVVAIIAVLVAVAIPVFTSALEKSQKATDDANIRAAYAEHIAEAMGANGFNGTIANPANIETYVTDKSGPLQYYASVEAKSPTDSGEGWKGTGRKS